MENYIKGKVLGVGTFGEVWKATHKQVGACVLHARVSDGYQPSCMPQVAWLSSNEASVMLAMRPCVAGVVFDAAVMVAASSYG